MRTAMMALVACGWAVASWASAQEPDTPGRIAVVREIDLKFYRGEAKGDPLKPTRITNDVDLARAIPDQEVQDRIQKQLDFGREKLLSFAWTGSGQDTLTFRAPRRGGPGGKAEGDDDEKAQRDGLVVVFLLRRGRTLDLAPHFHLYALRKDVTYRVREVKDTPKAAE